MADVFYARGMFTSDALVESAPLLLVGAGHSHLLTLRRWLDQGWRPPAGTLLVNPGEHAWYSGMMPGLLAGRYQVEDCRIALQPLCEALDVRHLDAGVVQLDAVAGQVLLSTGQSIKAGCISLDCGAQPPAPQWLDTTVEKLPVKPFGILLQRWQQWRETGWPARIGVLGGGAAAFEVCMALRAAGFAGELSLLTGSTLLADFPERLRERASALLRQRQVGLHELCMITTVRQYGVYDQQRRVLACDALVLASGARAHGWQASSGLACDAQGFVRIGNDLRSRSHPQIFASGDCASLPGARRSGVYAVRQAPVLADNLRATLNGGRLSDYRPQRLALALLDCGNGQALLRYGSLGMAGGWCLRWKDRLDRRFIEGMRCPLPID